MTSRKSSFISPDMFDEVILPAYEKIYGYWKANGVQLIIHHSDSYGANLVPSMIRMGIDIWQGCMYGNNIPELVKKYRWILRIISFLQSLWGSRVLYSQEFTITFPM